jgi:hypothetical protein
MRQSTPYPPTPSRALLMVNKQTPPTYNPENGMKNNNDITIHSYIFRFAHSEDEIRRGSQQSLSNNNSYISGGVVANGSGGVAYNSFLQPQVYSDNYSHYGQNSNSSSNDFNNRSSAFAQSSMSYPTASYYPQPPYSNTSTAASNNTFSGYNQIGVGSEFDYEQMHQAKKHKP